MLFPDKPDFLIGVDDLLVRLEFDLPSAAIPLTRLPATLTRGQCLALRREGCSSLTDLRALGEERLRLCVGKDVAAKLGVYEKGVGAA